jgi:hypothetical protein
MQSSPASLQASLSFLGQKFLNQQEFWNESSLLYITYELSGFLNELPRDQ